MDFNFIFAQISLLFEQYNLELAGFACYNYVLWGVYIRLYSSDRQCNMDPVVASSIVAVRRCGVRCNDSRCAQLQIKFGGQVF